ncbi:MAG: P-loop NTPase fold protein [Phycisphaerales bacterium]
MVLATNLNDEPFIVDQLGRQTELLAALDTIVNAEPPLVIGVYGDWGTGKTSFMRALQALLDKNQRDNHAQSTKTDGAKYIFTRADEIFKTHPTVISEPDKKGNSKKVPLESLLAVWFNPWQHQFEKDPIFPLIDAIRRDQTERWTRLNAGLKTFLDDPRARILGKVGLGLGSLISPAWLTALTGKVGRGAKEMIDHFANFQKEFETCIEELTRYHGGKLVIFVDDIDRCEAAYTVRILESLKLHLLNPHCIFVLGCARERVIKALTSKLTDDPGDAADYLNKIIQLPMHLPPIYERQLKGLLQAIGRADLAGNDPCVKLLHAYAGDNPRRLKRFLMWHDLEVRKVDHVKELRGKTSMFFDDPAVFLKINLMRFVAPRHTVTLEQLMADLPGARRAEPKSEREEEASQ